jgi:hypothetical protein
MNLVILFVANPMIRESRYPNLSLPSKRPPGSERISAFQTLNRQFEAGAGSDEQVKMVGHQDKRMVQISLRPVPIKSFKE